MCIFSEMYVYFIHIYIFDMLLLVKPQVANSLTLRWNSLEEAKSFMDTANLCSLEAKLRNKSPSVS